MSDEKIEYPLQQQQQIEEIPVFELIQKPSNFQIQSIEPDGEQDRKLVADYPNLYRARHTTAYGLRYGFDISPGWVRLVDDLSRRIENEILCMPEEARESYYALQVKQKFAGLRFYMHYGEDKAINREIDLLIQEAMAEAERTCEVCGRAWDQTSMEPVYPVYPPMLPGFHGWRSRLCYEHFREAALQDKIEEWVVPESLRVKYNYVLQQMNKVE